MVVDGPVADHLDLGDAWDRLEVWVKDRLALAGRLVVAVAVALTRDYKKEIVSCKA